MNEREEMGKANIDNFSNKCSFEGEIRDVVKKSMSRKES